MSNIDGLGTGPTPTVYAQNNKAEFLADEAKIDQHYDEHLQVMKSFETLSKADLKQSASPISVMMRLKLSDNERSKLADVAEVNGWSRQSTEATYKMYVADNKGTSSLGDFMKALNDFPPGYYDSDGGHTLGLTEADRRRIMDLPPESETSAPADEDADTPAVDVSRKTDAAKSIASASQALNKKLTKDETSALSKVPQLNGVDEQSATAYYKMYVAQHSHPSMENFIQLITKNVPNAYGKDGDLKQKGDDDNRVIRVTI